MNYYNINTALFNYVSLRASSTVGFPGLHFVIGADIGFDHVDYSRCYDNQTYAEH